MAAKKDDKPAFLKKGADKDDKKTAKKAADKKKTK